MSEEDDEVLEEKQLTHFYSKIRADHLCAAAALFACGGISPSVFSMVDDYISALSVEEAEQGNHYSMCLCFK